MGSSGRVGVRDTPFSNGAVSARRRIGVNSVTAPLTPTEKRSTVETVGVGVLGPLQVDGQENGLSPRDRVVLSALVVRAGDPVSTEALADALWGDTPPATWTKVVQGSVVRLRKRLGVAAIESGSSGYRLTLNGDELDHRLFERLVERAREALSGGDAGRAAYLVKDALDLWRGRALTDLEEWEPGQVEAGRLEGMRMDAEELRVEAETRAGHVEAVLEQARTLVAQAPFRERRWALLATALHQAGRQAEALGAIKRARAMLVDELGLDPGPDLVELEAMLLRQDPSLSPVTSPEVSATCPYRGLLPYDAADADTFFGREDDLAACLRRLRDAGVLAVIGPSGVGKSSLVRAGVVASLSRSGTPVLLTTPGMHPMDSLVELKPRGRQTLVVDQTEEAVTLCTDPPERARYFAALAVHVGAGGALVLALRADHLGDLAPYPEIARVLEEGMYLLGPMSEPGLRSAIEGPARRAGLRLEPGLVDLLVREVEGEPAALPLLSHVLRETWERREGPTLTVAGYRATGGIRQAVSRSAESLYDAMDPVERTQLRSLLLRLVMPTEDGDPVRARVPRSKIAVDAGHERLVEQLVEARLVSIDGETLQIAHEALVRVWPRLRGWLDDDVDGQRLFRHLAGAADAWDSMGRPDSELYRGTRLTRTLEWRDRASPDLDDTESTFLDTAAALAESELRAATMRIARERTVNRRLRGALAGVGVLLVLALVAGVLALRSADQAQRNQDRAEAAADRADQERALAEARRASAQGPLHENLATGLLLAVQALKVDGSSQAWENLGVVLTRAGALSGQRDIGELVGRPGTAWIAAMDASEDGRQVAVSVAADGVQLLDGDNLEPMAFEDPTPMSSAVAFSPSGHALAVAVNQQGDGDVPNLDELPVRLYDLPGGRLSDVQLGGFQMGDSIEYALDFSDDGRRLATVVQHYDRRTGEFTRLGVGTVWDLARPSRPIFRVPMPEYTEVALSPDGERLLVAMGGDRPVRVYDVAAGRLLGAADNRHVSSLGATAVDLSRDGKGFVVASGDELLRYEAHSLRLQGPALRGHDDDVEDVEYSHDGRLLASASADGTAIVWDARSGKQLHRYVARGGLTSVTFSSDDQNILVAGGAGLVQAWAVTVPEYQLTLGEEAVAGQRDYDLSLPAPDGHTLARAQSGRLWFEDTRTGRRTRARPHNGASSFQWSPDSRWLLASGGSGVLTVFDSARGSPAARRKIGEGEALVAFSPDGRLVYLYPAGGTDLGILVSASLEPAYPPTFIGEDVHFLVPHPKDGTVVALRSDGSFLRVDPQSGKRVAQSRPGLLFPEDQAGLLSPDGSLMVVPGPQRRVRLLDVESQEYLGNDAQIPWDSYPAYAPDGSQFAVVQAQRLRFWDGRTGAYQASLPLPSLTGNLAIAYRPDGPGLVLASTDGRTWIVDTRVDTWTTRACAIAGRNLSQEEWGLAFPDRDYDVTCPQWPPAD